MARGSLDQARFLAYANIVFCALGVVLFLVAVIRFSWAVAGWPAFIALLTGGTAVYELRRVRALRDAPPPEMIHHR